jgi:hypothetical protein
VDQDDLFPARQHGGIRACRLDRRHWSAVWSQRWWRLVRHAMHALLLVVLALSSSLKRMELRLLACSLAFTHLLFLGVPGLMR